jgi:CMP-N-acetylneuraminic acid synthetase
VKFTLDQLKLERASQFFCTLFINSPLRDSRLIDAAINMAEVYSPDSVICVDEITSNLFKESASGLQMLSDSQDFNKYEDDGFFVDNSAIYVTRASFFEDTRKLNAGRIAKLVIPKWSSFKIETHSDLQLAELIINCRKD